MLALMDHPFDHLGIGFLRDGELLPVREIVTVMEITHKEVIPKRGNHGRLTLDVGDIGWTHPVFVGSLEAVGNVDHCLKTVASVPPE